MSLKTDFLFALQDWQEPVFGKKLTALESSGIVQLTEESNPRLKLIQFNNI